MLKAQALSGSEWVCRMVRTTMADWARALLALESGLPDAHGDLGRAQFITSVWHEFLTHPFANIRFFFGPKYFIPVGHPSIFVTYTLNWILHILMYAAVCLPH